MLRVLCQETGQMFGQTKKHLEENKMSYWKHFAFASSICFSLSLAVSCLLIHSIIPSLFVTTGSNIIKKVHNKII
jgi:hypothetical protein